MNYNLVLKQAEAYISDGEPIKALNRLAEAYTPDTPFNSLIAAMRFCAKRQLPATSEANIAFLGGGTLDFFRDMLGFWLIFDHIKLIDYLPPYGVWQQEILSPFSSLFSKKPKIVWLFNNRRDFEGLDADSPATAVSIMCQMWETIRKGLPGCEIVQNNCNYPAERVNGNLGATNGSLAWIQEFNYLLIDACRKNNVLLFDFAYEAAYCGLAKWEDPRYWLHSKSVFSPEVTPRLSFMAAKFLSALKGKAKKCIVLDLDNTLWGGVIGDDGIEGIRLGQDFGSEGEAFSQFQEYLRDLSRRGIVLTVCSKNNDDVAKMPFLKHPGMRLSLDDIAVFKANWNNKADNIRDIADILNLGLDSFVFLDDNPSERELVRLELPMVATAELPSDPALYTRFLDSQHYFEMATFSMEDMDRTRMYRAEAARADSRKKTTDMASYLTSLEMRASIGIPNSFTIPRVAQLINKSNQFHLTTTRYSEAELLAMMGCTNNIIRYFTLSDRFGDHGLIAAIILKKLDSDTFIIDTWVMSCRVLERGMEQFIYRHIVRLVKEFGARFLIGSYIPTSKNGLVSDLYKKFGFIPEPGGKQGVQFFKLNLVDALEWTSYIVEREEGM